MRRFVALAALFVPACCGLAGEWTKEAGIRVADGSVPYVYRLEDGSLRLLFCGRGGILSARSTDGLNFTPEPGVRLAPAGGPGDPESIVCDASVVRLADGRHRLYYKGANGPGGPGQSIHRVFSALSGDGLNYTREGLRLESANTIDGGWASVPEVIQTFDGRYRMYYVTHGSAERNGIVSAVSDDGITFTREEGTRLSRWVDPAVVRLPSGQYWMFGLRGLPAPGQPGTIGSAHSADGLNFVEADGPLVSSGGPNDPTGTYDPTVIDSGQGRYRMYYGGGGPSGVVTLSAVGAEPVNPAFGRAAVVSAADSTTFEIAPASLATAYGGGDLATADNPAGTRVEVNGRPAQALFARGDQVNFAVPANVTGREAQVVITAANGRISTALPRLSAVVPRLFPAPLDARLFTPGPFRLSGEPLYIAFFGTGIRNAAKITVTLGGRAVGVLYAGAQPSVAGLDQINVLAPADFPLRGTLEVLLAADGRESNRITVELK